MGINVLSLFDGMSCGRIALERAGIEVDNYYASEIDRNAMKVSNDNYPDIIQLGDINNFANWNLPNIDLIIGGSPCQSISNAGGKEGMKGKSNLFFKYVGCLDKFQPEHFLLENVCGNLESIATISDVLNVDFTMINSNEFSFQNRRRNYWTNFDVDTVIEDRNVMFYDHYSRQYDPGLVLKGKGLNKLSSIRCRTTNITNEKVPCLMRSQGDKPTDAIVIRHGDIYRYPTREECELMQTVPLGYTKSVAYRPAVSMLGNGWTVDVIAHILKGVK